MAAGVVFELLLVAPIAVMVTGKLGSRTAMLAGLALLPPGLVLLVLAQLVHTMPVLFVASAMGGVSAALGYRDSLEVVNRIAPADRRSEVVSSYLVAVYLGAGHRDRAVVGAFRRDALADLVFPAVITVLPVAALVTGAIYAPRE